VYLRDEEDRDVREMYAAQVEFDRVKGQLHVRGDDDAKARVYTTDDFLVARQVTINLNSGQIFATEITGEVRR
jgi:hypothetical protein